MGKQCFTCQHKRSREVSQGEKVALQAIERGKGNKFYRAPNLMFHCDVTKKPIKQTDPACDTYLVDEDMADIRKMLSDTAKKLRKELGDK